MDADAATHHPGEDHTRYLLTVVSGYFDPADVFGDVTLPDCPGCEYNEVESSTFQTPVLGKEVSH